MATDVPTTPRQGPARPSAGAVPGQARRVDGSMSLLVDMMANTLDEAYAERAARAPRAGGPVPPGSRRPRSWRGLAPVAGLVAVGLVTGTAVAQVRARQTDTLDVRSGLAQEVRDRTRSSDELAARAAALRDEVAAVREQSLGVGAAGRSAALRLEAVEVASGTTAVRGPGVVVTLDDAPADDAGEVDPLRGGTVPEGRVSDKDLQDAVNGLWAAGAEAIAVNGQRLTALTAIRSAGESVLVDLRPLSPPYVVEAVGDPAALEVDFGAGPSGRRLTTLTSLYGIAFDVRRTDGLVLPGSRTPELRVATPAPGSAR